MNVEKNWTVEKKIPVALIATLVAQIIGLAVWGSRLDGRVAAIEDRTAKLEVRAEAARDAGAETRERFARTEASLIEVKDGFRRVESKLDRLLDDRQPNRVYGPR